MAAEGHSQSLERGLAILSSFRDGRQLVGISDLGRELGLSRSTAHRYVATLAALGYLQQDPSSRKYRLGLRVLDLGFSAISSMELRTLAAGLRAGVAPVAARHSSNPRHVERRSRSES